MIPVLIGISLLLAGIGFLVNENNAKYLLAGYNMMTKEERAKFDIKSYLLYFRKFHLFLGISLLVIGVLLTFFMSEGMVGLFISLYPIIAYMIFIWKSAKYTKKVKGGNASPN